MRSTRRPLAAVMITLTLVATALTATAQTATAQTATAQTATAQTATAQTATAQTATAQTASAATAVQAGRNSKWQIGKKLSRSPRFSFMPGQVWIVQAYLYQNAHGCTGGSEVSRGALRESGDYIYVRDMCKDGRSAIARLKPTHGDVGTTKKRVCRNKSGHGTWVRCNFNWPEGVTACFTGGVYNGSTGFIKYDRNYNSEICGNF